MNNEFIHEYNFLQQKRNLSDNEEIPEKSRKHDIYSKDNIERKIKNVILKCFKVFLNKKIKKEFNDEQLLNIKPELLKSPKYDFHFPLEETQYTSLFPFCNKEFIHEYNFLQQKRNLSDNEEIPEKSRKHDIYSKDNIERKIKNVILKM